MTKSMTVTRPYDTRGNSEGSRDNSQNDSCRKIDDDEPGFAGVKVTLLLVGLQSIFIVLFGVFLRYNVQAMPNFPVRRVLSLNTNSTNDSMGGTTIVYEIDEEAKAAHDLASKEHIPINYAIYQDVHVMMFVGFGFLMTFLYRYGLSSVAYNFLLGAMCIQWATLTDGWIRRLRLKDDYYILVNINTMIDNDFAVATALIGFGAVLGKVNLLQLTVMGFFQIALYQVNCLFVYDLLKADDPGCSLVVHTFGAYFGLTVARIIHRKEVVSEAEKKESSVYHSDIFSMIGTLFLWTLYPSFNAATATDEGRIRAIINTYFSLCASVMTSFAMTNLVCKGKFNMVHVQNSTLAGGVAVGTMAQMIIQPWGAVLVGSVAGVVSVLGFQFVQPALRKYLGIHDTCGVHNLHGMPGLIAGFGSVLAGGVATWGKYGDGRLKIFGLNGERTLGQQAGYQAAAIATSLGTALVGGAITGIILRLPIWDQPRYEKIMDDSPHWVSVVDIPRLSISNNDDKSKSIEDFRYIGDSKKNSIAVTEFSTESS